MKNKNLFLTGILTIALSCPAFATGSGIGASDTTADCDNSTLGTYEGESNLQAQWTANTIHLNWYNDSASNNGTTITPTNSAAATCSYDGAITLPTNPISKPGYEFAGWRVRTSSAAPSQPQQTTFDLSTLNASTTGIDYSSKNFAGDYCYYYNEVTGDEIDSGTCNESAFSGLSTGEWKMTFEYGTVKGEARCSTQRPTTFWYQNNYTFTSDHFASSLTDETGQEDAQYCWCKPTGFDAEGDGTYLNVSSSSWVFNYDNDNEVNCAYSCAYSCADFVNNDDYFRRAVFGVTQ